MYQILRRLLFLFPAEKAHRISLSVLKFAEKRKILELIYPYKLKRPIKVMGITFPNAVGLAAGLDKNGSYINALASLGFGFIEIGTVTPRPQAGNPQPRLFRLPEAEAIINRLGFNNQGIDYLIQKVQTAHCKTILGINIGKNLTTPVTEAVDDYLFCMRRAYVPADYITINISSPNTPGLRNLQYGDELQNLLSSLKNEQQRLYKKHRQYTPLAVKISPDLIASEIETMAKMFLAHKIDAIIATNTTVERDNVKNLEHGKEQGGLSGKPLNRQSTWVIKEFYKHLQENIPIIGVGGISSGQDAREKIKAGAKLVQLYTGFIYQGPDLIKHCVKSVSKY